jgi:uncharacterized protein
VTTFIAAPLRLEFKAADGSASTTIRGLLASYGNVDRQRQRFAPGAFAKSLRDIAKNGVAVPLLVEHDRTQPAGRWTSFRETQTGLQGEATIDEALGAPAQMAKKLVAAGIAGLSVGFVPSGDGIRYDDADRVLQIDVAELVEGSLTTTPANAMTRVLATKSLGDCDSLPELRDVLQAQGLSSRQAKSLAPSVWRTLNGEESNQGDVDAVLREIAAVRSAFAGGRAS